MNWIRTLQMFSSYPKKNLRLSPVNTLYSKGGKNYSGVSNLTYISKIDFKNNVRNLNLFWNIQTNFMHF